MTPGGASEDSRSGGPGPDGFADLADLAIAFALFMVVPAGLSAFVEVADDPNARLQTGAMLRWVGVVLIAVFAFLRRSVVPVRWRPGRALLLYVGFLVIWFPLAMIVYPYVVRAVGHELPAQNTLAFLASAPRGPLFWGVVFLACVGAPIAEELFFRGFLFRAIERVATPVVAIVVTSVLFGIVHEVAVALPITLLGLLFGYVRYKAGGVGSAILVHMVHNTWTVAIVLANPELMQMVFDTK